VAIDPEKIAAALDQESRRGWLRWLVIALVIAAVGAGIWWYQKPKESKTSWRTGMVDRGDVVTTASATGNLAPKREVAIGAEISGRLLTVEVDTNDLVEVDQVLARFDTEDLESAIKTSKAALRSADASVRRSKTTLNELKAQEKRTKQLVERGVTAGARLDEMVASRLRAQADYDKALADAARARASLEETKSRLDKAVIRSPIKGVVLVRTVEPGNTVAASFQAPQLFVVAEDLSHMELLVGLDEADIGLVKVGQEASFEVSAYPDRQFKARVEKIALASTVDGNVVTYQTTLSVKNEEGLLRPGMTATTNIVTGKRSDVLRIPNAALRFKMPQEDDAPAVQLVPMRRRSSSGDKDKGVSKRRDKAAIYVLRGGVPERVYVGTGRSDGKFTEVTSGELEVGEEVLTGIQSLRSADKAKGGGGKGDRSAGGGDKSAGGGGGSSAGGGDGS
jgi:HlyD family secretion protein